MEKKGFGGFTWKTGIIFFLDAFIAFALISGAGLLIKTEFGKISMIFGFVMLFVTTALKLARKW